MRFYIALATFFLCYSLSTIYASEMAKIRKLGSVSYWQYRDAGHVYYAIYISPYGKACYLNDEIEINCEEII